MRKKILLGIFVGLFSKLAVNAQEVNPCVELIRTGIFDTVFTTSEESQRRLFFQSVCSQFESGGRTGFNITLPLPGGGILPLSFEESRSLAEAVCQRDFNQEDFARNTSFFARTLNPTALSVVQSCLENETRQLHVRTVFTQGTNRLDLTVSHTRSDPLRIMSNSFDPSRNAGELDCRGSLMDLAVQGGLMPPLDTFSLTCERRLLTTPVREQGRLVRHRGGTIKVSTTQGDIIRVFPPLGDFSDEFEARLLAVEATLSAYNRAFGVDDNNNLIVTNTLQVKGSAGIAGRSFLFLNREECKPIDSAQPGGRFDCDAGWFVAGGINSTALGNQAVDMLMCCRAFLVSP